MLGLIRKWCGKIRAAKTKNYIQRLVDDGLTLGKDVKIVDNFFFDRAHCYLISIGDNTIIAPSVRLVAHDASTKLYLGYTKFGKIDIKENCFIGHSVTVLPNVTIGPNSIIGAGSVVTQTVPPNSVAVGAPAKVVSSLKDYKEKFKPKEGQKIFSEDYHIWNLDEAKRKELLDAADSGGGFIV